MSNTEVKSQIWLEFKLVQDIMLVLVTCRFDEDNIKNEGTIVSIIFSPLHVYGEKSFTKGKLLQN